MINKLAFTVLLILSSVPSSVIAGDFEIVSITPIFNEETPYFGEFKILAKIKNNKSTKSKLNMVCYYAGLSHPGIYYNDQPQITKQYKIVNIDANKEVEVQFDKGFRSYHPEVKGELIISISGTGIIKSVPLQTRFSPRSKED